MSKYIMMVALVGLVGCGPDIPLNPPPDYVCSNTQAITNGYDSIDRRATVYLHGCSGVIIGPHTVLTAAHCTPDTPKDVFVTVQNDNLYNASATLPHPDYTNQAQDDIGLIYVQATLPEPYAEIALPAPGGCYSLVMQGYGRDDNWESGKLHEASAYIIDTFPDLITYEGPDNAQICFGDSGGPLYAISEDGELLLVSIASKLVDNDCQDGYGMGPNLQEHLVWITENTY